jgi:hypothetical protein
VSGDWRSRKVRSNPFSLAQGGESRLVKRVRHGCRHPALPRVEG